MKVRKTGSIGLGIAAIVVLAGCTSVSTEPDQTGLQYQGGSFSSKKYGEQVPPSTRAYFGPGDRIYLYPIGQRAYDATGGSQSEHPPFTSSSKDSVELATPMSVTFQLRTDEKTLRAFHEQIGIKYKAYVEDDDSSNVSDGWVNMLNFYMGQSLDTTVDRVLAGYDWRAAYNDAKVRVEIENAIKADLPTLVKAKMGGDYFDQYAVQVQRPVPTNQQLRDNIAAAQNNVAQAQAAEAKAKADEAAAHAQVAVAQQEAAKKAAAIKAYGSVDEYNKAQAIEKGINPYQPTIVYGGAPVNK